MGLPKYLEKSSDLSGYIRYKIAVLAGYASADDRGNELVRLARRAFQQRSEQRSDVRIPGCTLLFSSQTSARKNKCCAPNWDRSL